MVDLGLKNKIFKNSDSGLLACHFNALQEANNDQKYLVIIFVVTILFWIFGFNYLNAICIHRTVAKSKQIPVKLMDNLFAVLVALIVMLSIKWVGILIINALLILPAASSRNIASNMREYHLFSLIFSVFSGVVGLVVSYYTNVATGPMIVILASVIYFATYIYGKRAK